MPHEWVENFFFFMYIVIPFYFHLETGLESIVTAVNAS